MSKAKMEKVTTDIARTKAKIDEYRAKSDELEKRLDELEKHKTAIENDNIIAMFRKENISEDEFLAIITSQRKPNPEKKASLPDGAMLTGGDNPGYTSNSAGDTPLDGESI